MPSVFTFDGELVDCNFNVNFQRVGNSKSLFKLDVSGQNSDGDENAKPRRFQGGSSVLIDSSQTLAEQVDVVIARVELLLPIALSPKCRLLLQDELTQWVSTT
jgi:hypothetical protein